jgi:hypothetical protein
MRLSTGLAALGAVVCLFVSPALALPAKDHPGKPGATGATGPAGPSGAKGPSSHGKAYGYYCQGQSKRHVAGQKGTPFSQCVTAMAKLATGKADSPEQACAGLSKAHVKGEKGTPFSRCVSAGAKLLKSLHK